AEEPQNVGRHHFTIFLVHEHGCERKYEERREPRRREENNARISSPISKAHDREASDESKEGWNREDDDWQPFRKGRIVCAQSSVVCAHSSAVDESHHADRVEKKAGDDVEHHAKHSAYHVLTPDRRKICLHWDETGRR